MWPILFAFFACDEEKIIVEDLVLTPTESLNFDEVAVGEWRQENIGLINAGNDTVDILSVTMVDVSANVWDLTWTEQANLAPGEMAEFSIRFEPVEDKLCCKSPNSKQHRNHADCLHRCGWPRGIIGC